MTLSLMLIVCGYLIGSIPSGYLLIRAFCGLDVRHYGSGNVGTINVVRVGGPIVGGLTLAADIAKGTLPVIAVWAMHQPGWLVASMAFALLVGHAFSFWLLITEGKFSEGKCVATSLGVLIGLSICSILPWWVPLALLAFWVGGLVIPKLLSGRWWIISPITMSAAVAIAVLVGLARPAMEYVFLGYAMSALILVRHKNNLARLFAGTEPRIGDKRRTANAA
jgi:glycerol-3-phosphate acyltransferase PlsY